MTQMQVYTIKFRIDHGDGSDTEDLLDDLHDFVVELGHPIEVVRGEFGPNWFALVLELPDDVDASDLATDLARDFNSGFPHQQLVSEIADDAGRRLFPQPTLAFDA